MLKTLSITGLIILIASALSVLLPKPLRPTNTKAGAVFIVTAGIMTLLFTGYLQREKDTTLEEYLYDKTLGRFQKNNLQPKEDPEDIKTEETLVRDKVPKADISEFTSDILPTKFTIEFCEVNHVTPAKYKTVYTTYEIEGHTEYVVIPPTFETVIETLLVAPTYKEGAVFETVAETVVVQESSIEYVATPATFQTINQPNFVGQTNPIIYRTVSQPASVAERQIPAIIKTHTRRVIKQPGTGRQVPAVTKTSTRRVVKTPSSYQERFVPAETRTVPDTILETEATTKTVNEVCNLNNHKELKNTLVEAMVSQGLLNAGDSNERDLALALGRFQIRKGIDSTGTVSTSLLNALDIEYQVE